MNGIINVLKPPGMTSQDVVSYVKRTLKEKKAGHTGTLDPGAAGVLPVCLGKATKIVDYIMSDKKTYICELTLGNETDTCDKYGSFLFENFINAQNISYDSFRKAVMEFTGVIKQTPPIYSAVKINGIRAYDLARKGIEVQLPEREVVIHSIDILSFTPPTVMLKISCSKGTYIRSLCRDIGQKLGVRGFMSFLIRTETGNFSLESSHMLYEITPDNIDNIIVTPDFALNMKCVYVDKYLYPRIINGNRVPFENVSDIAESELVKVYIKPDTFAAIGKVQNGCLCIDKLLI